MSLNDNTAKLQAVLAAVNELPDAGAGVTVDGELSAESTNPVQNKVIKEALDGKQDAITGAAGQVVGFDANGKPIAANKPTYTAAEVGAIAKTGGTMTGVLTNTNGGYTLERGNLIVGKNDSTNKNYVRMYRVHPTSGAVMRSDYQLSDGGSIKYDLYHGSEQKNSLMLTPDYTSFGKPVDVAGGGTGVKSYEALAEKLGIGAAAMSILDGDLSEPMSDDELTEKILNGEVSA